jgi:HAD superfamily hydrolase (TIGR01509 family)
MTSPEYLRGHHAFLDVGKEVPCWRILGLIGRSGSELVRVLLGDELADKHGSHVERLRARYFVDSAPLLRPFPGARELLEAIPELGWRVVLATSAGEELAVLRDALDAEEAICAVTSSADADRAKPHPDVVATALERIQADPFEAIMLGDTVWDIHAGRRAGVPTAAVLSGGIPRSVLDSAGAAAIYEGPLEVRAQLEEFSKLLGQ